LTKYVLYKVKRLLTTPELIGWAILFVEFWVFMWFYVFGSDILSYKGMPYYEEVVKAYISVAYSSLSLITLGSVAIGITSGIFASSISVRYVTKFGRLSPRRFFLEDFISSTVVFVICVSIIILSAIGVGYMRYGVLVVPKNALGLFLTLLAFGAFSYLISINLGYLAILTKRPKLMNIFSMIPLILAFVSYGSVFTKLSDVFPYIYPFNALAGFVIYFSLGKIPPGSGYIQWLMMSYVHNQNVNTMSLRAALAAIVLWMVFLTITAIVLIRKSRGVSIEELRIA